jgi:hypothetical protein
MYVCTFRWYLGTVHDIYHMHLNAYNIYEASHTCTCTYTYIFIYTYRYIPGYNLNYLSILFPRSLL